MLIYRLGRTGDPANDGTGAALYGGRWNPISFAVIYAAESRALCVLEVLVHNAEVSAEYSVTTIHVPDELQILKLSDNDLPDGWNGPLAPCLAHRRWSARVGFGQRNRLSSKFRLLSYLRNGTMF
jgi:RES domain-containing protein